MASFMVKFRAHANSVCNWHFCTVENLKGGLTEILRLMFVCIRQF